MERSSFVTNFSVRASKVRKNGLAPIEITITINGERSLFSTGKSIPLKDWDKVKQRVKGKSDLAVAINAYLQSIRVKLIQKEAELLSKGFIVTASLLQDAFMNKIDALKDKTLFQVFQEHIYKEAYKMGNYTIVIDFMLKHIY